RTGRRSGLKAAHTNPRPGGGPEGCDRRRDRKRRPRERSSGASMFPSRATALSAPRPGRRITRRERVVQRVVHGVGVGAGLARRPPIVGRAGLRALLLARGVLFLGLGGRRVLFSG